MLYERTALSKKPEKTVKEELDKLREEDRLSPEPVFRDAYSEKDLEQAILREMESFILKLGTGFSFVARQKRITIGDIGAVSEKQPT